MNKRATYLLVVAGLFLTSCAKETGLWENVRNEEITFNAFAHSKRTKAGSSLPDTIAFGVTAFHSDGTNSYKYIDNAMITNQTGVWKSASTQLLWPRAASGDGTALNFRCYAPYDIPWCTCTFSDIDNLSLSVSASASADALPVKKTDAANDLLYSDPVAQSCYSAGQVMVPFNHALSLTAFSFQVERFDDSVEKGKDPSPERQFMPEYYYKYTDRTDRESGWKSSHLEECSFVMLSGNSPARLAFMEGYDGIYSIESQAFDLANPIQNIWQITVKDLRVMNLAWNGSLDMSTGSSGWELPDNKIWTIDPSNRNTKDIDLRIDLTGDKTPDDFYLSPNTKGYGMPLGGSFVIPQDLFWNPVTYNQNPQFVITLQVKLFRAEENAQNDAADKSNPDDPRGKIFDYRDIFQYINSEGVTVDGTAGKSSGAFKQWKESAHYKFPNAETGIEVETTMAILRTDVEPLLDYETTVTIPLYDWKRASDPTYTTPRYLEMNTKTSYSIVIDPATNQITFDPKVDSWSQESAEAEL